LNRLFGLSVHLNKLFELFLNGGPELFHFGDSLNLFHIVANLRIVLILYRPHEEANLYLLHPTAMYLSVQMLDFFDAVPLIHQILQPQQDLIVLVLEHFVECFFFFGQFQQSASLMTETPLFECGVICRLFEAIHIVRSLHIWLRQVQLCVRSGIT
jgi:hypothetical protein